MSFKELNLLKLAIGWMIFFTAFCLTNSVLTIGYQIYGPDKGLGFAFFLPFVHMFAIFLFVIVISIFKGEKMWQSKYIRQKYPHIAQQIYPDEDYVSQPANPQKKVGKVIAGAFFLIFALTLFYKLASFKSMFVLWIVLAITLPFLILIGGIVALAFYKFLLQIFKGRQAADKFIERMKQKSAESKKKKDKEKYEKQKDKFENQGNRRLFRGSQKADGIKAFLRGDLDSGCDERLNQIKLSMKYLPRLIFWAFLLTPAVWIFNLALLYFFYWRK